MMLDALAVFACKGAKRADTDRIDLTQNVTAYRRPQDKAFANFEKNWRQFTSNSPELAAPVTANRAKASAWQPRAISMCVYSDDAKGLVAEVSLTWNEPGEGEGPLRFDLAIHHNGLSRKYYSSALSTGKGGRFQLPSTSALLHDEEAALLTGPGLFAKIGDYDVQGIQPREGGSPVLQHTLALRDLSQGLSYTIRLARRADGAWQEIGQYVFLTPVCPR
jgi:hypothetical protein